MWPNWWSLLFCTLYHGQVLTCTERCHFFFFFLGWWCRFKIGILSSQWTWLIVNKLSLFFNELLFFKSKSHLKIKLNKMDELSVEWWILWELRMNGITYKDGLWQVFVGVEDDWCNLQRSSPMVMYSTDKKFLERNSVYGKFLWLSRKEGKVLCSRSIKASSC